MNTIARPEKKFVEYGKSYRALTEVDQETGDLITSVFKQFDEIQAQVIRQDKYTVVIFEDGSKGISECGKGERFSRKHGLKIAYYRALIEHLQRLLKNLCEETIE